MIFPFEISGAPLIISSKLSLNHCRRSCYKKRRLATLTLSFILSHLHATTKHFRIDQSPALISN